MTLFVKVKGRIDLKILFSIIDFNQVLLSDFERLYDNLQAVAHFSKGEIGKSIGFFDLFEFLFSL